MASNKKPKDPAPKPDFRKRFAQLPSVPRVRGGLVKLVPEERES